MYICPICKQKLNILGNKYVCNKNHSFDLARQGYVNLLPVLGKKSLNPGDNDLMTNARREFLAGGYYDNLLNRLCEILQENKIDVLVDSGCSEGYYTRKMANVCNKVYAYDISKSAVKLAAATDKKSHYFVESAFHIPLEDNSADAITKIFAPDSPKEFSRVLQGDGILIEVVPAEEHLLEIKQKLYENVYLNKVEKAQKEGFKLVKEERLKYTFTPTKDALDNLFKMTPYYYKTAKSGENILLASEIFSITADFVVRTYKKQG